MKIPRRYLILVSLGVVSHTQPWAQDFGPPQVITTAEYGPRSIFAADLDGDGYADVLSASEGDNKVSWYANQGDGSFGSRQVITISVARPMSAYAADLDNDGRLDVLSASYDDDKIAWYPNLGGGAFGPQQVISTSADSAVLVYAADLSGDGRPDVISASTMDNKIAWYPNLGGGAFGPQQVIVIYPDVSNPQSVYAIDLDGDSDLDVLSASLSDSKLAWYENAGGGVFGPQQVISKAAQGVLSVFAADLDGDGDADVLSASLYDDKIAWYENQGGGVFGPQQVISTDTDRAYRVYSADLDGDGDSDVLSASLDDGKIAWYRNQGGGVFGSQQVITTGAQGARALFAADLDGDRDSDVLSSACLNPCEVTSYENLMGIPDCNGNGIPDWQDIANGTSADCDGDIVPDECTIADDPSVDWNGDDILDVCTPPNYCTANPNTTGQSAVMSASGSPLIVDNNFTITASQMPAFEFGYFLMANSRGFIPNVGGSAGNLCLGTPIYRFVKPPTGTILSSGSGGTFSFTPNLLNLPQGVIFQVGETWNFQAWYRDGAAGTSNFTDGIEVMFR